MKPALNTERRFSQSWFFLFFFVLSFSVHSAQALSNIEKLTEQNYRTLSGRLRVILETRFQGLSQCSSETQESFTERLDSTPAYSNKKSDVVQVLELYQDSLQVEINCRQSLDQAEMKFHSLERNKFSIVHSTINTLCDSDTSLIDPSKKSLCLTGLMGIVREIDPHCMSVHVPNPKAYYDGFPCISGDNLIGKFLHQGASSNLAVEIKDFLQNLRASLADVEKRKSGIELYWDYLGERQDSLIERKRFLAVLALLTSSTSSYGSYIEGYHDHSWRSQLLLTGDAETALDTFNQVRLTTDDFRTLNEFTQKNKFKITLASQNMYRINRHDIMSAFLACYYTEQGSAVQNLIPKALGYSYEFFDFASHLREGTSIKASKKSFVRDTGRYREGAAWGAAFCRQ